MPCGAIVERSEDSVSEASCIERITEVGIAFRLFVEAATRPGVAIVAGDHDALSEHGGKDLPIVAVDAENIAAQAVVARLPRSSVVEGTVNAAPIGGNKHGFFVVGHEIGVAHVSGESVRGVFTLGAFGGLVNALDVGGSKE